jgi:hypothetical protein
MARGPPENAGEAIRFTRGKYKGKSGFHNDGRDDTDHRVYVFIELRSGSYKETFVRHTSIAIPRPAPATYAEVLVDQHPDIEGMVDALCNEVARTTIIGHLENDPEPFFRFVHERMLHAIGQQRSRRGRTYWRIVQLPDGM